ncbi:MAG: FecR domain-containing protein [Nodosilinea sp.]
MPNVSPSSPAHLFHRFSLGTAGFAAFLTVLAAGLPARADVPLTRADVESILNRVEFIPRGRSARAARMSDFLGVGDALRTAAESRAQLRFNDGSLARVGERATFRFVPNTRNFRLSNGTMLLLIPPGRGRSTIQTPSAITGVQGSAVVVRYIEDRDLTVVMALTNNPAGPMTVTSTSCGSAEGAGGESTNCATEYSLYAGQMALVQDNRVDILEFDLPTFYQTSPLIEDLNLDQPDTESSQDPATGEDGEVSDLDTSSTESSEDPATEEVSEVPDSDTPSTESSQDSATEEVDGVPDPDTPSAESSQDSATEPRRGAPVSNPSSAEPRIGSPSGSTTDEPRGGEPVSNTSSTRGSLGPALEPVKQEILEALAEPSPFTGATVLNPAAVSLDSANASAVGEALVITPGQTEDSASTVPQNSLPGGVLDNSGEAPGIDTDPEGVDGGEDSGIDGGVTPPGTDGGVTPPGTDGSVTPPGTDGGVTNPGTDGGVPNPGTDGSVTPPGTDGGVPNPGTDGGVTPPGTDGGVPNPGTDGGVPNPGTDGSVTPPGTDGGVTHPGADGGVTHPGTDSGVTDPGIGGVVTNPGIDSGVTNPGIDGGVLNPNPDGGVNNPGTDSEAPIPGLGEEFVPPVK